MSLISGLTEVCRQLLVLAGLSLFLDVLLPSGNLKKYSQFVMGLLLVAALLNPLLGLTRGLAPEIKASVFTPATGADNTDQIIAAGSNLAAESREQAAQELAAGLERQISSLISLTAGVEECQVAVELDAGVLYDTTIAKENRHNWGQVIIVLTVEQNQAAQADKISNEVRQTVADFYDIAPAAVQVSVASYSSSYETGQTTDINNNNKEGPRERGE